MKTVRLGTIEFCNTRPMVFMGGVNVLESRDLAMRVAEVMTTETTRLNMPYVFKASFDKANRSSNRSYRGPGIDEGLKILQEVRTSFGVPVLTDIHLPEQATVAAEVCDVLQLPAFLARQTDLIEAIARTGKVVNVKKPQFMSPSQIGHVVEKLEDFGNHQVVICERGSSFGYDNLVVDMLGFGVMKTVTAGVPIVLTSPIRCKCARPEQAAPAVAAIRRSNSLDPPWHCRWPDYSWRLTPIRTGPCATVQAPCLSPKSRRSSRR